MHIALVAMSGVRAYNAELTAIGLSLPGFFERGKPIASLPSLGLLTLAATVADLEAGLVPLGLDLYSQESFDRRRAGFKAQAAIGLALEVAGG